MCTSPLASLCFLLCFQQERFTEDRLKPPVFSCIYRVIIYQKITKAKLRGFLGLKSVFLQLQYLPSWSWTTDPICHYTMDYASSLIFIAKTQTLNLQSNKHLRSTDIILMSWLASFQIFLKWTFCIGFVTIFWFWLLRSLLTKVQYDYGNGVGMLYVVWRFCCTPSTI